MYQRISTTLIAGLACAVSAARADEPNVRQFLRTYCLRCHGAEKQEGDRQFDTVAGDLSSSDTLEMWQDIVDQLNLGEMPPTGWASFFREYNGPRVRVFEIEIEGPLYDTWPPKRHIALFGNDDPMLANAEPILRRFASRAFRRPVSKNELNSLVDLVRHGTPMATRH